MEPLKLNYNLTEILADLVIYQNPKILKGEYTEFLDTSKMDSKVIEKYQKLLSNIDYSFKKILKYEFYFQEFYPNSDKISNVEALNYHIHSYLEDSDILKNKIEVFLGSLKNDIKETLGDNTKGKEEIEDFFRACVEKTIEVFAGISEHRNPHHHNGMRFMDGDLLKAENAYNQKKFFQIPPFSEMVKPERLPEFIAKLEREEEESFKNAQIRWVTTAKKNSEEESRYLDTLVDYINPYLYNFLRIIPSRKILELQALKTKTRT